jgi:hypothetical protein
MSQLPSGSYGGAKAKESDHLLNADVAGLHASWRSEAQSPEILPFRARLVRDVSALLKEQQVRSLSPRMH